MKITSLDNGYRFFAPDPGPSHLLRYELVRDEKVVASGIFPDRQAHFPRLLYHRYFMIAETMASQLPPPLSPEQRAELSPADRHMYGQALAQARLLQRSIARHLLHLHPEAETARLYLRTHVIPGPLEILQGKSLTDPMYLQEVLLGAFPRETPTP
jgi:hypothetical protein